MQSEVSRVADVPRLPNGPAWAALLAAGIGAFAVGFIVVLNETGIFASPTLYGPAGGVSGRTTLAVVVWLVAWVALNARWKDREIVSIQRMVVVTLTLIALGLLGTFPPFWSIL